MYAIYGLGMLNHVLCSTANSLGTETLKLLLNTVVLFNKLCKNCFEVLSIVEH